MLQERVAPPKAVNDPQVAAQIKPSQRNMAGVGMTLSNWMGWKVLQELQIQPDMVCGQSAGDLVSMSTCGNGDLPCVKRHMSALDTFCCQSAQGS